MIFENSDPNRMDDVDGEEVKNLAKTITTSLLGIPSVGSIFTCIALLCYLLVVEKPSEHWLFTFVGITWAVPISSYCLFAALAAVIDSSSESKINTVAVRYRDLSLKLVLVPCCVLCIIMGYYFEGPFKIVSILIFLVLIYMFAVLIRA